MNLKNKIKALFSPGKTLQEKTLDERRAEMIDDYNHHSAEDMISPRIRREDFPPRPDWISLGAEVIHKGERRIVDAFIGYDGVNLRRMGQEKILFCELSPVDVIRATDFPSVLISELEEAKISTDQINNIAGRRGGKSLHNGPTYFETPGGERIQVTDPFKIKELEETHKRRQGKTFPSGGFVPDIDNLPLKERLEYAGDEDLSSPIHKALKVDEDLFKGKVRELRDKFKKEKEERNDFLQYAKDARSEFSFKIKPTFINMTTEDRVTIEDLLIAYDQLLDRCEAKEPRPTETIDFKGLRVASRLTLREVEKSTGISNPYLSQLENGKIKSPSHKIVKTLTEFYNSVNGTQARREELVERLKRSALNNLEKLTDPGNPLNFKIMDMTPKPEEPTSFKYPTSLNDLNLETPEGILCFSALAIITSENRRDKTPDEVIAELIERSRFIYPDAENPTAEPAPKKIFEKTTDFPLSAVPGTPENDPLQTSGDPIGNKTTDITEREIIDQLDKLQEVILNLDGRTKTLLFNSLVNQFVKVQNLIKWRLKEEKIGTLRDNYKNAGEKILALETLINLEFKDWIELGEDPIDTAVRILSVQTPFKLEESFPPSYRRREDLESQLAEVYKEMGITDVKCYETETGLRILDTIDNGQKHISVSHPERLPTYEELKWSRYTFAPEDVFPVMGQLFPQTGEFVNLHETCLHLWEIRHIE